MSATASPSSRPADIVRDVVLWRRKKISICVVLVATATSVLLEVYEYNFITVASWAAMVIVTSAFLWGNILRLFNKEPPNLSAGMEIREETTVEMANELRWWMEEGIRWMFRVGAEGDWFVFTGNVAALWLVSKLATFCDLLTLLYIGIVVGMTVPVIYVKYEDKLKSYYERFRMQCKRFYSMLDDKVLGKIKKKVVGEHKVKKTE
ncbi:reticulon-like protein B13 [Actinidia eriantha]|uniref:reticulon-like protein B13 n=1 Tax=Actinidia eriantha TaxID=165200 RepID=UPI002583B3EC|nr:reticulon-like protein B13 [Actinidia eriantha]